MQATRLDPDVEAQLRAADLTYDHVGGTSGVLPDGRARKNLDRHPNYILAEYMASGT